jgi:hypothetical protein
MGLNTRMKYSYEMLDFFKTEQIKGAEPKAALATI